MCQELSGYWESAENRLDDLWRPFQPSHSLMLPPTQFPYTPTLHCRQSALAFPMTTFSTPAVRSPLLLGPLMELGVSFLCRQHCCLPLLLPINLICLAWKYCLANHNGKVYL